MDQTTKFANSKKRMIRMSAKGAPFVVTADGKKQYRPKAAFKKNAGTGSLRVISKANVVPKAIAPASHTGRKVRSNKGTAGVRKTRSNMGVARGPQPARALNRIMAGRLNAPARGGPRKTRSNKGVKRALIVSPGGTTYKGKAAVTRRKTVPKRLRGNPFASLLMM
jgi:hypothetical protein